MTTEAHRERVLRHLSQPLSLLEALRQSAALCDFQREPPGQLRPKLVEEDEEELE
jgi:hypothetical protein